MKNLMNKWNLSLFRTKLAMEDFLNSERGDTNFISIAIILIAVIVIAIVFITFGQDLTAGLEESIENLKDSLGI